MTDTTNAADGPAAAAAPDFPINQLVRVRVGGIEKNMGRTVAELDDNVEILNEPTHSADGRLRGETGVDGRPIKPKTTVAGAATAKKAASSSAADLKEQS